MYHVIKSDSIALTFVGDSRVPKSQGNQARNSPRIRLAIGGSRKRARSGKGGEEGGGRRRKLGKEWKRKEFRVRETNFT